MTIAEQLITLNDIKSNIKTSIVNKGVAVEDNASFISYCDKVEEIKHEDTEDFVCNSTSLPNFASSTFKSYSSSGSLENLTLTNDNIRVLYENMDTSKATTMSNIYNGCTSLKSGGTYDCSSATTLKQMFYNCSAMVTAPTLTNVTSKITNVEGMFQGCSSMTSVDISGWDFTNTDGAYNIFNGCTSLTSLIGNHTLAEVQNGTIKAFKGNTKTNVNLSYSNIDQKSAYAAIKGVGTVGTASKPAMQFTFSTYTYNLLTSAMKTEANNKGWNVMKG